MYQKEGAKAYKPGLDNLLALDKRLGHPHRLYRTIHVAGTNGKGSVSHLLASIFQEAGFKTGLYTSPHIKDFRERIKINGSMIPEDVVSHFVEENMEFFGEIHPSFFEVATEMALFWFAKEHVDVAIIEVGLGGRLDSTNIITPALSVITNISLDHTAILGETLEEIAREKAGIIKECVPVVVGRHDPATAHVFEEVASLHHAPLTFASEEWSVEFATTGPDSASAVGGPLSADSASAPASSAVAGSAGSASAPAGSAGFAVGVSVPKRYFEAHQRGGELSYANLECELTGGYQRENIATVLEAVNALYKTGARLSESEIRRGIAHVVRNTSLLGRWQMLSSSPLTICDTGHNPDAFRQIAHHLSLFMSNSPANPANATHTGSSTSDSRHNTSSSKRKELRFVLGFVNDKDVMGILRLLPKDATYYLTQPSIPRGLPIEKLTKMAEELHLSARSFPTVAEALEKARSEAGADDLIYIGGSTFVVAEVL